MRDGTQVEYTGVRTHRWVYVRWVDGSEELYNHNHDPWHLDSVAANGDHGTVLMRLRRATAEATTCTGSSCLRPTRS